MVDAVVIGLMGASGIIIGSIITIFGSRYIAKKNHEYNLEKLKEEHKKKLDYMKEESFFQKKLEYFERIAEGIEDNILFCNLAIVQIESCKKEKDWGKIIAILDKSKILQIQGSPLYSDNLKQTAIGIVKYLRAWGELIRITRKMPKTKSERKNLIEKLEKIKEEMISYGKETIEKMREELK